jgi:hypothetical protein
VESVINALEKHDLDRLIVVIIFIYQVAVFCSCSSANNDSSENDDTNRNNISVPEHYLSELLSDNHIVANPGDTVNLTASGSYSFDWSLLLVPNGSNSTLSNNTSSNTSMTLDIEGVYYVEVNAYLGETYAGSDYAIISTASVIHYVRQGVTGSNDGSNWTNAYTSLPAKLIRGHTYYIAQTVRKRRCT